MRDKIAVTSNQIKGHSVDLHTQEAVGPNVADLPELRLAGPDGNGWRHYAIHRHKFLVVGSAGRMVLEKDDPFLQRPEERIETFTTVNDDSSGHTADDLAVDNPVEVG